MEANKLDDVQPRSALHRLDSLNPCIATRFNPLRYQPSSHANYILWCSETFNTIVSTSPLGLIFFCTKGPETSPYKTILIRGRNKIHVLENLAPCFFRIPRRHAVSTSRPSWGPYGPRGGLPRTNWPVKFQDLCINFVFIAHSTTWVNK
jgi:hypothetical protein